MARIRNTRQQATVLDALRQADHPLTAGEVYARARAAQPTIAKSTVYRNLEGMLADGMVTQGRLENGESYYALACGAGRDGADHRHYLICRGCGRMQDLPECPLGDMERRLADSCGFTVTDHTLQIYGLCRNCRREKGENGHAGCL